MMPRPSIVCQRCWFRQFFGVTLYWPWKALALLSNLYN